MATSENNELDKTIRKTLDELCDYRDENHYELTITKLLSSPIFDTQINTLPIGVDLMVTEISGSIFFKNTQKLCVERCKSFPIAGWTHIFSLNTYRDKMAAILQGWANNSKNIQFGQVDNDEEYFDIWYSIKVNEETLFREAISSIAALENELSSATEIALSKGNIDAKILKSEAEFTNKLLLPLFRSMLFKDVQYYHGKQEFGKDITFTDIDKLGIERRFGVQVKVGDLTGEANST